MLPKKQKSLPLHLGQRNGDGVQAYCTMRGKRQALSSAGLREAKRERIIQPSVLGWQGIEAVNLAFFWLMLLRVIMAAFQMEGNRRASFISV